MSTQAKYFPSTDVFFKYLDNHPYVAYQGEEIKVPLSGELKGLDTLTLAGAKGFFVRISDDETHLILTNTIDGGTF